MNQMGVTITLSIAFVCMVVGIILWLKVYNLENGERYMKHRMQGSFAPLDVEDIETYFARRGEEELDFSKVVVNLERKDNK
jgi:hypothetical protein